MTTLLLCAALAVAKPDCNQPIYNADGLVVGLTLKNCEPNTDRIALPPPPCDFTELLAAARALMPVLDDPPACVYIHADFGNGDWMRDAADEMDRQAAAIARLRKALDGCKEKP